MTDFKSKTQNLDSNVHAQDVKMLAEKTGNIYQTLTIVATRANQVATQIKEELSKKLNEFSENTDAIEEIMENKEQIEISKSYERLPNPAIIAMSEFTNEELMARTRDEQIPSGF